MWLNFFNALRELWKATKGAGGSYRPDLHYMRDPGPKWRANNALSFAVVPVRSKPIPRGLTSYRD